MASRSRARPDRRASPCAGPARRPALDAGRPVPVRPRGDAPATDVVRRYAGMRSFGVGPDAARAAAAAAQRGAVPPRRCARPGLLVRRLVHRALRRGDGPRHRDHEAARIHHAAQAHQGRAAAVVPPLRPARDARLAGHGQRRRQLPPGGHQRAGGGVQRCRSTPGGTATLRARRRGGPRALVWPSCRAPSSTCATSCRIAVWVPFNEGWGQFDAAAVSAGLRELDPTRTVDHASGWHDQGAGDLTSLHVYVRRLPGAPRRRGTQGRALALTEYGGYSLRLPEHSTTDAGVRLPAIPGRRLDWPTAFAAAARRRRSSRPSLGGWRRPSTRSCPTSRTRRTACSPTTVGC